MTPAKALKSLETLKKSYPNPKSELDFTNNYQLLIAVMLSAQCTDKKVNQVTPSLFRQYQGFKELAAASSEQIEQIIREVNYYKTKAKNIRQTAEIITNNFNAELPLKHSILITLPGVGNKTANVVLSELGVEATFPVDTHVFRVSRRIGMAAGKNVTIVEQELKKILPKKLWREAHHLLILHGRKVCKASSPRCSECTINSICKFNNEQSK